MCLTLNKRDRDVQHGEPCSLQDILEATRTSQVTLRANTLHLIASFSFLLFFFLNFKLYKFNQQQQLLLLSPFTQCVLQNTTQMATKALAPSIAFRGWQCFPASCTLAAVTLEVHRCLCLVAGDGIGAHDLIPLSPLGGCAGTRAALMHLL